MTETEEFNGDDDQEVLFDPDEYLMGAEENASLLNEKLKEALAWVDEHYGEALQRLATEGKHDRACH